MTGYWPSVWLEDPAYWDQDPCDTCGADPCVCDQLTDEARDADVR